MPSMPYSRIRSLISKGSRFSAFLFILAGPFYSASPAFSEEASYIGEVTVTGTREEGHAKDVPSTINAVKEKEIRNVKPVHPAEIMNRVPGAWISSTGGEGHVTSIRQPLTTSPVYLFLEDGGPIRATGFFNHNALSPHARDRAQPGGRLLRLAQAPCEHGQYIGRRRV